MIISIIITINKNWLGKVLGSSQNHAKIIVGTFVEIIAVIVILQTFIRLQHDRIYQNTIVFALQPARYRILQLSYDRSTTQNIAKNSFFLTRIQTILCNHSTFSRLSYYVQMSDLVKIKYESSLIYSFYGIKCYKA